MRWAAAFASGDSPAPQADGPAAPDKSASLYSRGCGATGISQGGSDARDAMYQLSNFANSALARAQYY